MKKIVFFIFLISTLADIKGQNWFRTYDTNAVFNSFCSYKDSYFAFGQRTVASKGYYHITRVNNYGDTLYKKSFVDYSDTTYGGIIEGQVTLDKKDLIMTAFPGYWVNPPSKINLKLIKTDTLGNVRWTKTFLNTYPNPGYPRLIQTLDTGYAIFGEGQLKGYLIKTDKNGNQIFRKDYGYGYKYIRSAVQNTDSGFTACGSTNPFFNGIFHAFIIRMKSNGDTLWTKNYYDSDRFFFHSICHEPSGGYYVCGLDSSRMMILKLTSTGGVVWKKYFNRDGYLWDIKTDINNYIIASGLRSGGAVDSVYFVKFDNSGNRVFEKAWTSSKIGDQAVRCFQHSDTTYMMCGTFSGSSLMIKMDTVGAVIGIKENKVNRDSKIFPNPNNGSFKLSIEDEIDNGEFVLYNAIGQEVYRQKISNGTNTINLIRLSSGFYSYSVFINSKKTSFGKLVLE